MVTLELVVKLLGWAFVLVPVGLFTFVASHMFLGVAKEDGLVQMLVFLFSTVFIVGAVLLAIVYGTDLLVGI
ncbi:hypothetical protein A2856_02200 [Candidatus Uhrbacteria bacterium RIFCSPHIGHO2_01_FULL_63_20]|uniref:Uncharacterized protein n=1 Tax=Candidatus Uhrbacteria bacterium RIFCSPHIGHO2_01_FULL_63_20 TaxID=1802385 RepID=A0A1F7TKH7_9BACT|nr:MAG: hypothetical protein A2856_02200 [Candidatus Uhrbacteria bacterium RIFCSPHIGHO2_01_FULL_63_20]